METLLRVKNEMDETAVVGKWYVVDNFSGPVAGPFDTKADAEKERVQLNNADDCFCGKKK